MLTIKNLTWNGLETLHMAEEVSYFPDGGAPNQPSSAAGDANAYTGSSVMYLDRGEWHQIHDGNVYVMNDKGATVANYRLGGNMNAAKPLPIQGGTIGLSVGAALGQKAA